MKIRFRRVAFKHAGTVAPSNKVVEIRAKKIPVLTKEGRARLEAKAKVFDPKKKYPVFNES